MYGANWKVDDIGSALTLLSPMYGANKLELVNAQTMVLLSPMYGANLHSLCLMLYC